MSSLIDLIIDPYSKLENEILKRLSEGIEVEHEPTVVLKRKYTLVYIITPVLTLTSILAFFPFHYRNRRKDIFSFLKKAAKAKKSGNIDEMKKARELIPPEFWSIREESELDDMITRYGEINDDQRDEEEIRIMREKVISPQLPFVIFFSVLGFTMMNQFFTTLFRFKLQEFIKNEDLKYLMFKKISWKLLPPGTQGYIGNDDIPKF